MSEGEPTGFLAASHPCGECEPDRETGLAVGSPLFIPTGWKLVPIEPTQAMLDAGKGALYRHLLTECPEQFGNFGYRISKTLKFQIRWQAMLAAAPEPPCGKSVETASEGKKDE